MTPRAELRTNFLADEHPLTRQRSGVAALLGIGRGKGVLPRGGIGILLRLLNESHGNVVGKKVDMRCGG